MQVGPRTRNEWVTFILLPFKAFAIALAFIVRLAPRAEFPPLIGTIILFSLPLLFVGALIQIGVSQPGSATLTWTVGAEISEPLRTLQADRELTCLAGELGACPRLQRRGAWQDCR